MLLDTHIWLWALIEPARLSRAVRALLASPAETLRLSPVSVWEALVLAERGRVALEPDPRRWVDRALAAAPVAEAPLTFEVAMASRSIALDRKDPADRFIAATAQVFGLTLVTADARLLACPDIETLPNR